MRIVVNDEDREVPTGCTVAELLASLGYAETRGLAVAVNDAVHPRSGWAQQRLAEADRVVLIRAAAGG